MTAEPVAGEAPPRPTHEARLAAMRATWLAPRSGPARLASAGMIGLIKGVTRLLLRVEVSGHAHLPARGPVLICPNHSSLLDPLVMITALTYAHHRRTTWAGDVATTFGNRFLRVSCWFVGVFPLDRRAPRVGLSLGQEVLEQGDMLVWMPEGVRSYDGRLLPFRAGVGTLIRDTGAPVVPVRIVGAHEAWPRGRHLPRLFCRIRVEFGPPIPAETLIDDAGGADARAKTIAEALRRRYLALAASD